MTHPKLFVALLGTLLVGSIAQASHFRPVTSASSAIDPSAQQVVSQITHIEDNPETEWGMKITTILPGGAAEKADLHVGDIVVGIGGKRIQSFDEMTAALAKANGAIEVVFINVDNGKLEKMMLTPVSGKIGVATEAVELP